MSHPVISPKKLIEVALPLDAINAAAAREKSIRHGHPSTLHLWWARRPLAAARAVIFSQLVHDPEDLWRCQNPGVAPNKQVKGHWTKSRAKLFAIIEDLVKWENTANEAVLEKARDEIRKSWRETCELNKDHPQAAELFNPYMMPGLHDPFAGGGAIPLEAQRLGIESFASDLNPVAVLINKATIEVPPKFADLPPVNPDWQQKCAEEKAAKVWQGAKGLADDIRFYGKWMRDEARERIGPLYPSVEISKQIVNDQPELAPYEGQTLKVIAWLWARTVKSPNPAFSNVDVPLASSFVLSTKVGKEAYVEPVIREDGFRFVVKAGKPTTAAKQGTKAGRGSFRCLMSQTPLAGEYLRSEASGGRMGQKLMAIVVDGPRGRFYVSPTPQHEAVALSATPSWSPDVEFYQQALGFRVGNYGMTKWSDLFSARQLTALTTFSDLVVEARRKIQNDMQKANRMHAESDNKEFNEPHFSSSNEGIELGGDGGKAYSEAISLYLAFGVSKLADYCATLVQWSTSRDQAVHVFGRQALPMVWDFCEVNVFAEGAGDYQTSLAGIARTVEGLLCNGRGTVLQLNASDQQLTRNKYVSTDPPYYDNIGYADLSDFFYMWLRNSLREAYPTLVATISVPKSEELVATPGRHGSRQNAERFFLDGMTNAMKSLASLSHPSAPITIYYAFKQSETESEEGTSSTGWATFLDAIMRAGFSVTGTWPVRTERPGRMRDTGSNALASSIVLVCRRRLSDSGVIARRQFVRMLNEALPQALDAMTRESEGLTSPVAPVDLSQAIIGPGMAIFSRYEAVLEADGSPMTIRTALQLINRFLAEDDFDADTQFCLRWFEQHGWESGVFGEADVLARAKGTSVEGVKQAGVVSAAGGSVRLFKWKELDANWDPAKDSRIPIWQVLHQLILAYDTHGESGAASLYAATVSKAEAARQLAYRLYTLCERRNWAEDARAYNDVVTGWSGIESAAAKMPAAERQGTLFASEEIR